VARSTFLNIAQIFLAATFFANTGELFVETRGDARVVLCGCAVVGHVELFCIHAV
jgi:hypothetical protein